jgi:hypothetical protein
MCKVLGLISSTTHTHTHTHTHKRWMQGDLLEEEETWSWCRVCGEMAMSRKVLASTRSWKKHRSGSSWQPAERVWLCFCFAFTLQDSRLREPISVVLGHPVCGSFYMNHRKQIRSPTLDRKHEVLDCHITMTRNMLLEDHRLILTILIKATKTPGSFLSTQISFLLISSDPCEWETF